MTCTCISLTLSYLANSLNIWSMGKTDTLELNLSTTISGETDLEQLQCYNWTCAQNKGVQYMSEFLQVAMLQSGSKWGPDLNQTEPDPRSSSEES